MLQQAAEQPDFFLAEFVLEIKILRSAILSCRITKNETNIKVVGLALRGVAVRTIKEHHISCFTRVFSSAKIL